MKRIIFTLAILGLSVAANSAEVQTEKLTNESALAYSTTYDFYLNSMASNRLSAVVVYTTATPSAATFTDGATSTGSFTVVSTSSLYGKYITIHGYQFIAGNARVNGDAEYRPAVYPVGVTITTTAVNIAYAVRHHPVVGALIAASTTGARVDLTSRYPDGIKYALTEEDTNYVKSNGTATGGGTAVTIISASDKIYSLAHTLTTGLPVLYSTATQTNYITGLTNQTTYFAIRSDANNFKLGTTKLDAIGGTAVDVTVTVGGTAHTLTLTPLKMNNSTAGFNWQESNDGTNFLNIPSISSVSFSTTTAVLGGTVAGWDFSWFNFKWLRLNVTGPDTGGIYLKTDLNVKQ